MTNEQDQLLRNIGLLVCSLAQKQANALDMLIANELCDGPNSYRARDVPEQERRLKAYQRLISETREMAKK